MPQTYTSPHAVIAIACPLEPLATASTPHSPGSCVGAGTGWGLPEGSPRGCSPVLLVLLLLLLVLLPVVAVLLLPAWGAWGRQCLLGGPPEARTTLPENLLSA